MKRIISGLTAMQLPPHTINTAILKTLQSKKRSYKKNISILFTAINENDNNSIAQEYSLKP